MATFLFTHPACLEHDPGAWHPESPARLAAVLEALKGKEFSDLVRLEAPRASIDQISRVHKRDYVEALLAAVPQSGRVRLDPDTAMSPGSGEAALRATGAACAAVDAVMAGEADNAFCAVRPPGHHAEPAHAMGFCLFNSVAVGAAQARAVHGLERIAVVDFDVHHGNGTQDIFWDDETLFYGSTHQMPLYPGTGDRHETGAHGNILNVPLPPGTDGQAFRSAMEAMVLPALEDFAPELVLISAGFDAHAADPLAQMRLVESDFAWATRRLCDVAESHARGRVVSTLEGGYDLPALAASVVAHVGVLMERGE